MNIAARAGAALLICLLSPHSGAGDDLPSAAAAQLLAAIERAPDYGLRTADYLQAGATAPDAADAMRFIHELHYGRIDPRAAGFELPDTRNDVDVAGVLADIGKGADVPTLIASIEPRFYHYRLLKDALARYRRLAGGADWGELPPIGPRTLRTGDAYTGAAMLKRLLGALGDLTPAEAAQASDLTLDSTLQLGVRRFQARHGLTPSGEIDRATHAALATPLAARVRQIELALERARWLPPFDSPPIVVNIPQFELFAFQSTADRAAEITQMPVIVGKSFKGTQTPVFMGAVRYIVFRPYWNVPRSILVRELLPKLRANPGYLVANHLEIVRGESDSSLVVAATPGSIEELAAGRLRLRQRPGPDNALGPIKFVFPNSHDVYLHSTPAQGLFRASRRSLSHGCIRVEDPVGLAAYVLRNNPGEWTAAKIAAAMAAPEPLRVDVTQPVTVILFYSTALATEAGAVLFFDDIYGHDRRLEALLAAMAR